MKCFSIVGWSGSGKTRLIEALITHFKSEKKKVLAVKKVPHHYDIQPEGKDTHRFLKAGADEIILATQTEMLTIKAINNETEFLDILKSAKGRFDIVLIEGMIIPGIPAIETLTLQSGRKPKYPRSHVAAYVASAPMARDIPCFLFSDLNGIIRFMEEYHE